MTQPEALRLADLIRSRHGNDINDEAAAELRRLHAENEALQNTKHYEAPPGFVLNPDYLVPELRAQRDALLEALKKADHFITNGIELGFIRMPDADTPDTAHETPGIVRAAIKAVKEGK